MPKAALAAAGIIEFLYDLELHLLNRHEHHLRDAFSGLNLISGIAAIPAGNVHLPLVVGIDQAGQITQHQSVFVSQTRSWQEYSGQISVADVNSKACWHQHRFTWLDFNRRIDARTHVQTG